MESTRRRQRGRGGPWVTLGVAVAVAAATVVAAWGLGESGPPVIRLGGATADGAAPGMSAEATAEGAFDGGDAARDIALWHPVEYRFETGSTVTVPADEATAWRLAAPEDLEGTAVRVAERLGVPAPTPAPWDDDAWWSGADDGSGPTLWVGPAGSWHFSDPSRSGRRDCVEPALPAPDDRPSEVEEDRRDAGAGASGSAGDGPEPAPCPAPEPPTGLPDAATTGELARELFAAVGTPAPLTELDVHVDEWGTQASAVLQVGGVDTDLFVHASFGQDAALVSASGELGTLEEVGRYPTIDVPSAVERLQDPARWGGVARPLPATAEAEQAAADLPLDAPEPAEPGEVEVVTVTLVAVEPALSQIVDVDGTRWLIPSYRFTDQQGGAWQVLAVADGYLEVAEPIPTPDPAPDVPADDPDTPVTDGGEVAPDPGDQVAPDEVVAELEALVDALVGADEAVAVERVEAVGGVVRVVARDGEHFAVTDDLRYDRVNVEVVDGEVVDAWTG